MTIWRKTISSSSSLIINTRATSRLRNYRCREGNRVRGLAREGEIVIFEGNIRKLVVRLKCHEMSGKLRFPRSRRFYFVREAVDGRSLSLSPARSGETSNPRTTENNNTALYMCSVYWMLRALIHTRSASSLVRECTQGLTVIAHTLRIEYVRFARIGQRCTVEARECARTSAQCINILQQPELLPSSSEIPQYGVKRTHTHTQIRD